MGSSLPTLGQEISLAIAAVEAEARSRAGSGFAARAAAIERLEVHVLDRLQFLAHGEPLPVAIETLGERALELHRRLEDVNERYLQRLRRRMRAGRYTAAGLLLAFERFEGPQARQSDYDALDWLVAGLLDPEPLPEEHLEREPEMVFYQPTPARVILEFVRRAGLEPADVVYDLGSGLGHVVMLASLFSGARAVGVEFEPAYAAYAERSARRLGLPGVEFICGDARQASLSDGTVYFLYTPFRGTLLRQVLARLEAVAATRPIRVCTYGPCTEEVAESPWLAAEPGAVIDEHSLVVFRSAAPA